MFKRLIEELRHVDKTKNMLLNSGSLKSPAGFEVSFI